LIHEFTLFDAGAIASSLCPSDVSWVLV